MSVPLFIITAIIRQYTSLPLNLKKTDFLQCHFLFSYLKRSFDKIHLSLGVTEIIRKNTSQPMSFKEILERILLIPWVLLQSASSAHLKAIIQQSTAHLSYLILRGSLENTFRLLRSFYERS